MKKRRNGKGFTLVELLVTIVVLGIITAMALPLVRKLRYDQDQKKYNTYAQSMEYSAKLYVDSYGKDMFQNKETDCKYIKYSDLANKKLIKDISVEDISCANDNSVVYVRKNGNDYDYYVEANCNGKVYPYGNPDVKVNCNSLTTIYDYNAEPNQSTDIDKKQLSINVTITSERGFNPYTDVEYYFIDSSGKKVTDNKKLSLDIPSEENQKTEVNAGHKITAKGNVLTPTTLSGAGYKLILVPNRLLTLEGEDGAGTPPPFGPYTVDNTPPSIDPVLKTTITDTNPIYIYNVLDPVFTVDINDNLVKNKSDFRICTSLDQDTCGKDPESIKKYQKLSGDKTSFFGTSSSKTIHVSDNYDSSKHKLYVTIADLAGNITTKATKEYTVGQKYTIKYNANATNPKPVLSRSEDYIILNPGVERTWGQLTSPDKGSILQPTRDYYKFTGWNTSANGSGETITSSTKATKDLTVYAQWKAIDYSIKYNLNGGTVNGTNPTSFNFETPTFTVINPTKKGYNFTGWSGTGISGKTMTLQISAGSHDNRTYTANWEPIKYTIEYYNGKTKIGSSVHTYDQAKELTKMTTLGGSQSGYKFYGWTDNNDTSSITRAYEDGAPVKNLTDQDKAVIKIYAIWVRDINFYSGIKSGTHETEKEYYNSYSPTYSLKLPTPKSISGWNTLGWRDDQIVGDKEFNSNTTKTTKSNSTSYYAVYSRTVTLSYNANGGSGSVSPHTSNQYYNSVGSISSVAAVTLRSNNYTKDGYKFSKWAAGSTSGAQYSAGASYTFNPAVNDSSTRTMYAIWENARYKIETSGQDPQYRDYLKDAVAAASSGSKITLLSSFKDQPVGVKVNKSIDLVIPSGVTLTLDYDSSHKEAGIVSSIYTTGSVTMNISGGGAIIGSPTESSYMFRAMDSSTMKFDGITVGVNGYSADVANVIWVNSNATLNINNSKIYQKNLLGGVVKISSNKTTTITNSWIYKAGRTNAVVVDGSNSGTINITNSHLGMGYTGSTGADSVIVVKDSSNVKMTLSGTNVMHGTSGPNSAIDIYQSNSNVSVNVTNGSNIYNLGSMSTDEPHVVAVRSSSCNVTLNSGGNYFTENGALVSENYMSRVTLRSGSVAGGSTCGLSTLCGVQSGSVSKTFKYMDNYNSEKEKSVKKNFYVVTK